MEVIEIVPHGFCEGVTLALERAIMSKRAKPSIPHALYGELIHNKEANENLATLGFEVIDPLNLSSLAKGTIVVFSAHGHTKEEERAVMEAGLEFLDCTCPFVTKNLMAIKDAIKNGQDVIYIGKKGHREAESAVSAASRVFLYEQGKVPEGLKDPLIVVQTTIGEEEASKALEDIRRLYPRVTVPKGRCLATKKRQEAIASAPKEIDLYVIVGSKNSNNANELLSLAAREYPMATHLLVDNEKELLSALKGKKFQKAAISSGASTPEETFIRVKELLASL